MLTTLLPGQEPLMRLHKLLTAMSTAAFLSGCSLSPVFNAGVDSLKYSFSDKSLHLSPEQIEKLPRPSIGGRLSEDTAEALLYGYAEKDGHYWYSSSHEYLVTNHARLMRTSGLQYNLLYSSLINDALQNPELLSGKTFSQSWTIDVEPGHWYGIQVNSTLTPIGLQDIEGYSSPLFQVDEHISIPAMNWEGTNQFWFDPHSHSVVMTKQFIHPDYPPIATRVIKPFKDEVGQ
ncbi:YjbF family lipoprotein [Pokkaliibacter sp. MBI-7]|uniref:YjbF family lipoprotein n=1 Tax=Pokkaliibacter sp. MBI-7 TaxID=3040600 RepID=UPI00244B02B4|nr:YjbF family lipoprotein [Pokkaliibacter sp. MBI-7]MDH2434210.1 YjbF family lipoprotein [Pokkaliibacter sp. MBI-7]